MLLHTKNCHICEEDRKVIDFFLEKQSDGPNMKNYINNPTRFNTLEIGYETCPSFKNESLYHITKVVIQTTNFW